MHPQHPHQEVEPIIADDLGIITTGGCAGFSGSGSYSDLCDRLCSDSCFQQLLLILFGGMFLDC